ncbi:MAG: permease-like cell division protein FtsX [Patescibacteria group bacterium]
MLLSFFRIIKFGFQSFFRNFWLTLVTVTIIVLSLLSISALGAVTVVSGEALKSLEQKIDVSIYLKPDLSEGDIFGLKSELETLAGVKSVEYTSSAEALVQFKEKYQDNEKIGEALILLGVNPLGASLTVKAYSEEGYQAILTQLEEGDHEGLIQEARFDDFRQVIAGVADLSNKVEKGGLIVSLIFLVIALLVVFNTIRINIYTHRQEIEIKRLVGSTNWFIRAPFWVESILYAFVATVITAIIFYTALAWLEPYIGSLFDGHQFSIVEYFKARGLIFFSLQFVVAAVLNILASFVAMRRYLKV